MNEIEVFDLDSWLKLVSQNTRNPDVVRCTAVILGVPELGDPLAARLNCTRPELQLAFVRHMKSHRLTYAEKKLLGRLFEEIERDYLKIWWRYVLTLQEKRDRVWEN